MSPQIHRTRWALAAAAAALTLVALPLTSLNAPPAEAGQGSGNPTMGAVPSTGLALSGVTTVQVTGRDYLVPPHATGTPVSGGIYVFFGWVDATKVKWGPSGRNIRNNDGNFGTTYLYPGTQGGQDGENESPSIGYVAFTKEVESGEAPEYFMDTNGDWKMPIQIPAAPSGPRCPARRPSRPPTARRSPAASSPSAPTGRPAPPTRSSSL